MSNEEKVKRTRKVKDVTRIIESIKELTYADKKVVSSALQDAMEVQAAEMREQAEATLKLIGE